LADKLTQGKVQVYTGTGKGKTTAAMGLALRAAGRGLKVFICQFMKGRETGEALIIKERLSDLIEIHQCGGEEFITDRNSPPAEAVRMAREALSLSRRALVGGEYDLVILDEVNVAVYFNLIKEEEVLALIKEKPSQVELVLTGRRAPASVMEAADLVTEMKAIKHYFEEGLSARKGIEY